MSLRGRSVPFGDSISIDQHAGGSGHERAAGRRAEVVLFWLGIVAVVVSSTLVSAGVGGLVAYLSRRALASRQARLDYEYMAKKRLYQTVGPLRFQLVVAARDLTSRVNSQLRGRRRVMTANE